MPKRVKGLGETPQTAYEAGAGPFRPSVLPKRERVKLGDGGRFVIPAAMREAMGVKPGDNLVMHVEDGELRVRGHREVIRRIQEQVAKFKKPGENVVDDFIRERREEQRRSDERFERLHQEGIAAKKGRS
jgi:AbrB family looped-hinge helix DNA binding protein